MSTTVRILFFSICVASSSLYADSYGEFTSYRQVGPTGRYYVVMKKALGWGEDPGRGGPVTFAYAERKSCSPPVTEESNMYDWNEVDERDVLIRNPRVRVRMGDALHGRGKLTRAPAQMLVSSTGLGFVTLDVFGYNYGDVRSGDSVIVVSKDGTIRHEKNLIDLFSESEIYDIEPTAGGVFWCAGGWIDERRRQVVIVSATPEDGDQTRLFRIVDWKTGKVRAGSKAEIVTALADVNRGALPFAIELAIELKLRHSKRHLVQIFENPRLSKSIRVPAAAALAIFGDRRGVNLLRETALARSDARTDVQAFAIRRLRELFGTDASALLREVLHLSGSRFPYEVRQEFKEIGTPAIPTLILMVQDKTQPVAQRTAARCLGDLGHASKDAVPALIDLLKGKTLAKDTRYLELITAYALGEIGPAARDAVPLLEKLESKMKTELEQIQAEEAITKPGPFESNVFAKRIDLGGVVKALRKIQTAEE